MSALQQLRTELRRKLYQRKLRKQFDPTAVSFNSAPPKTHPVETVASRLLQPIQKRLQGNTFVKNLGWLSASQAAIRVSRLAATVLLPRFLSVHDYGLAALVLTVYEFTQTFTRTGIFAKVIHASDEELEEISNNAYWLNWVVYGSLFILQCLVAFPVAWFYNDDQLILPICLLSLTLLISPIGRIQSAMLQRENRFKSIAVAQALRYGVGNILTAVFAVLGMGMWAIVLPKLLAAPLEFIVYLVCHPWRPTSRFTTKLWGKIFNFGASFLGMNLLKTLRDNLDYLIVGRFLGLEALGIYYFAFNAGLGISLTIIQSITTAIYPYLCKLRENVAELKKGYFKSLKTIALVIIPCVILQSALAPFYVPILFGEKWIPAIPILIFICLSAIPRPFDGAAFNLLAAVDKPHVGLIWNLAFTGLFAVGLLVSVQWQILGVAIAVFAIHFIGIPIFLLWSNRYVFGSSRSS